MTNSSNDLWQRYQSVIYLLGTLAAIAAAIVLWQWRVNTNAFFLVLDCVGWYVATWLAWTDLRRRRRDQAARAYAQEQTRDRALHRAISGPAWQHIGRTERDTVLAYLAEQYAAERLTDDDHEQRAAAATRAVTTADLRATLEGLL